MQNRTLELTQNLTQITAWQTARTNRVLDEMLEVAVEDADRNHRTDAKEIEKTSSLSVLTSLMLGDSIE